ncbi:MAG: universal stress protein [Cyclobacteriaceae bacterium]
MENLKTWLVGLDFTDIDQTLIAYTKELTKKIQPEKIYFVHVHPFWPDAIHVHLPKEAREPDLESLKEKMQSAVHEEFPPSDQLDFKVFEGRPSFDLWRETYLLNIDLFIAGSKPKHKGRGIMPRKFVKKSFCSVLFVPEGASVEMEKIWIPTDFSEYSAWAFEEAELIAGSSPNAQLICQHVYEYPQAYYYHDFPPMDVQKLIKEQAETSYKEFLSALKLKETKISPVYNLREHTTIAQHIQEEAEGQSADLIIMASGGRSRLSQMFLGSTTDKLVQLEHTIPVLILKHKQRQVRFWDLLTGT